MMSDYPDRLETIIESLNVAGLPTKQLAILRLKLQASVRDSFPDLSLAQEKFLGDLEIFIQTRVSSLGVETLGALLEGANLAELLLTDRLESLIGRLRSTGLVEEQSTALKAKVGGELCGHYMDSIRFLEGLEVLVKAAISLLGIDPAYSLLMASNLTDLLGKSLSTDYFASLLYSLPSPTDFGLSCKAMIVHIEESKAYILKTGLMPKIFKNNSSLNRCFLDFYGTKKTSSPLPSDSFCPDSLGQKKEPYTFIKKVSGMRLDPNGNAYSFQENVACIFEEADAIPRLEKFEGSLLYLRPKVVKLALEVLAVFEDVACKNIMVDDLVARFGFLITSNLSARELGKLLEIDEVLGRSGNDYGPECLLVPQVLESESSLSGCGLLTYLFQLLIYFIELKSVESFLKDSSNIKVFNALRPVAGASHYVSAIGCIDRTTVDEFLERVCDLSTTSVQRRGDTIGSLNKGFRENGFSEFNLPKGGLPFTAIGLEDQSKRTVSGEIQNIFRQAKSGEDTYWEVSFNGSEVRRVKDKAGYIYIRELLGNPCKPYSLSDLSALRNILSNSPSGEDKEVLDDFLHPDGDEVDSSSRAATSTFSLDENKKLLEIQSANETRLKEPGLLKNIEEELKASLKSVKSQIDKNKRDLNSKYKENKNTADRVKNAITFGKSALSKMMPPLGAHLNLIVESSDGGFVYMPDRATNWKTNTRIIS